MGVWTAIMLVAVRFLTGPRLFALGALLAVVELSGGNISLLLAGAMVVGFRYPAAWAFVILTKVTPGIGLLWFVVRREWRQLGIALGATAAIVAVSFVLMPGAWVEWMQVLVRIAGRDGTWAAVPIPFIARLPFAIAIVVWGARTNRRWTVPVAGMLALPALWYGGLSMLLAVIVLREQDAEAAMPTPTPRRQAAGGRDGLSRSPVRRRPTTASPPRRRPSATITIAPNPKTSAPSTNGAETPLTVTTTPASAGPSDAGQVQRQVDEVQGRRPALRRDLAWPAGRRSSRRPPRWTSRAGPPRRPGPGWSVASGMIEQGDGAADAARRPARSGTRSGRRAPRRAGR